MKQQSSELRYVSQYECSKWKRYLTLAAVHLLERVRPHQSTVLFLTRGICVKSGHFQHLSQADAIRFVGNNTSIPVPKVYCAFEHKDETYVVMSRIKGQMLGNDWSGRSENSKRQILEQLRSYIDELRALQPPHPGMVEGMNGSRLYDPRMLSSWENGFGPFKDIESFHAFITGNSKVSSELPPEVNELLELQRSSQYSTCFTHGDLSPQNILVHGDKIVGIVDWDSAGWYPEYWEYVSAGYAHAYNAGWPIEVDKFLKHYPRELHLERFRRDFFFS